MLGSERLYRMGFLVLRTRNDTTAAFEAPSRGRIA